MKRVIIAFLLCMLMGASVYAQRSTMSESWYRLTDYGSLQLSGKMNYGYVVGDDGKNLKDGPITINGKLNPTEVSVWPITARISGNYTLSANNVKGRLNGAASSSYKLVVTKLGVNSKTVTSTQTFSGTFKDGIPNGTFSVNSNLENAYGKLTATYNNGLLVGYFSCDINFSTKVQGSLTADGKPTGKWTFGDNSTKTFQNGVAISQTDVIRGEGKSTTPKVVALSKQYAAGAITEEQLYEQNIIVLEGILRLGDYARTAILENSGFEFGKAGGYDFSHPNEISYKYLKDCAVLTKTGEDVLIKELQDYFVSNKTTKIILDPYHLLWGQHKETPYIVMTKQYADYYSANAGVGIPDIYGNAKVYLSAAQLNRMRTAVDDLLKENATTLKDKAINEYANSAAVTSYLRDGKIIYLTDSISYSRLKANLNDVLIEVEKKMVQDDSNLNLVKVMGVKPYYLFKESIDEYKTAVNDLDSLLLVQQKQCAETALTVKEFLIKAYSGNKDVVTYFKEGKLTQECLTDKYRFTSFKDELTYFLGRLVEPHRECPFDSNLIIMNNEFIKKESIDEYKAAINDLTNVRNRMLSEPLIVKTLDFMVQQGSALSIAYDDSVAYHFYTETNDEYWKIGFNKRLKAFCPITKYEIIEFTNDYVVCKLSKIGKKKAIITYILNVKYKNGKLCADSFDVNNAKIM